MPSTYTPRRSILSSTDATPIVLTFSAGHNFTTGQTVLVAGHLVNSNANVLTTVTVIDGTHASLDGTTGTGAGAGGATGVVVTAPTGLTVPSDGDDVNASAFNSGIEGDADAAAYAIETGGRLKAMLFQTNGNFPVPANCNYVTVDSVSGGGGGGGGARPDNGSPTTKYAGGGGGGGGSPMRRLGMSVTPGTLVAVVVGAGGTAGVGATANNTAGADGGNGTASTFGGKQTSPVGGGGKGGVLASAVGAFGGLPLNTFSSAITASGVQCTNFLPCGGGSGGPGNSSGAQANGTQGAGNESTASGGPGGSSGNTVTGLGGSGGGGGAGGGDTFTAIPPAGLYTNVNVGGTGGAGSATTAAVGVAGTGGEANSGQGGGGGGGGGNGATASGNGGAGGAGATGKVIVWYIVGPNQ